MCQAKIISVDDNAPADFNNIQAAINDANNGDTIEVQPGTYTGPGNHDIDFLGKVITVTGIDPTTPNCGANNHRLQQPGPRLMAALLLYAYCRRIFSSRKMMAAGNRSSCRCDKCRGPLNGY